VRYIYASLPALLFMIRQHCLDMTQVNMFYLLKVNGSATDGEPDTSN